MSPPATTAAGRAVAALPLPTATASSAAIAASAPGAGRMLHVDGLRALAALAVALFHFRGYLEPLAAAWPRPVDAMVRFGYLGVNVFFVLSGFVIPHSLRHARYSPGFVARFALRRQVRLDPPYWVAMGIAIVSLARQPDVPAARLAWTTLAAHVVYLQNILAYPNLMDVFWTLCIEVQLYLAYVLLMWAAQGLGGGRAREALLAATTLASVILAAIPISDRIGAWFVWYWYMFALGAWARAALDERRALGWLAVFSAAALWRAQRYHGPGPALCVATAWTLVAAARLPTLRRALSARPLVYLGLTSYSFYLIHALAGGAALHLVLASGDKTVSRCALALGAALGAGVIAAHAMWWVVERPAIAWSRRVRLAAPPAA